MRRASACLGLLLLAGIGSVSSPARAETVRGWILDVDRAGGHFTLNDFHTYQIAADSMPAELKIGSTVNLTYHHSGAKMDEQTVTGIEILCTSFGATCPTPSASR